MKLIIFLILIMILPPDTKASPPPNLSLSNASESAGVFEKINMFFGGKPVKRAVIFKDSIDKKLPDIEKLKLVNDYFNKIPWESDISHWNTKDYWASPREFIESNAGDCEDYAIAKMIMLNDLVQDKESLKLLYTYVENQSDAHMVLIYHKANQEPLVLDNIVKEVLPLSKRIDLKPVYALNQNLDLWLVKNNKLTKIREKTDNKKFSDLLLKNKENPIE